MPALLLDEADTAMYRAKDLGKGRFEIFGTVTDRAAPLLLGHPELPAPVGDEDTSLYLG
jgi:hypothetical protein